MRRPPTQRLLNPWRLAKTAALEQIRYYFRFTLQISQEIASFSEGTVCRQGSGFS